jgi:uncharacterized protein (TIGR02466 family)
MVPVMNHSRPTIDCFTTKIFRQPIVKPSSALHKGLVKDAFAFQRMDDVGKNWSKKNYLNGYTSYSSITNVHQISPYYDELSKLLLKAAAKYWSILGFSKKPKLFIDSFWINIMSENCSHPMHIHPKSIISGSFYLKIPKGASSIRFEDPRMGLFMNRPLENPSHTGGKSPLIFEVTPRSGDVVLFESWLRHEVPPSRSLQQRISASFNISEIST